MLVSIVSFVKIILIYQMLNNFIEMRRRAITIRNKIEKKRKTTTTTTNEKKYIQFCHVLVHRKICLYFSSNNPKVRRHFYL